MSYLSWLTPLQLVLVRCQPADDRDNFVADSDSSESKSDSIAAENDNFYASDNFDDGKKLSLDDSSVRLLCQSQYQAILLFIRFL